MAEVEIDLESDDIQAWYLTFVGIPSSAVFEVQHKTNETPNNYFKEPTRTNLRKQIYWYATERWRDIKRVLKNKLAKLKLRAQLVE